MFTQHTHTHARTGIPMLCRLSARGIEHNWNFNTHAVCYCICFYHVHFLDLFCIWKMAKFPFNDFILTMKLVTALFFPIFCQNETQNIISTWYVFVYSIRVCMCVKNELAQHKKLLTVELIKWPYWQHRWNKLTVVFANGIWDSLFHILFESFRF